MSLGAILGGITTGIFLVIILSYYFLLFVRHDPPRQSLEVGCVTVIIPAHNEAAHIERCVASVLAAPVPGDKQVIVIDDGSRDDTGDRAEALGVTVLRQEHRGKSASINRALEQARGELISIVDADSAISENAFEEMIPYLSAPDVAAVSGSIAVRNRNALLGMWLHIEQLYNSLLRGLFAKVRVNIVTPGPISLYKRSVLDEVGGFDTKGLSEDVEVGVRMIRAGYTIEFAPDATAETVMPVTLWGFFRQRLRWARGWMNVLKRHVSLDHKVLRIYTLPLAIFWYLQALVMGSITLYQLGTGYWQYFASKGIYMSLGVLNFFFEWFSMVGMVKWAASIFSGSTPLTVGVAVALMSSLLTYPLYLVAIARYDSLFHPRNLLALFFMFPFWFLIMLVYMVGAFEYFNKEQRNIWTK